MDKKIGFLAVVSVAALMASGCSSFRGSSQGAYGSDGSGSGSSQVARSGQVAGSGQVANDTATGDTATTTTTRRNRWFGQQYRDTSSAATCKPCATAPKPAAQNTYTYRPAPKPKTVSRPAVKQAGQHNQQYYVDRWNRQQQQASKPAAKPANTSTYTGYGSGNYDAGNQSSSTYYDYSSASGAKPAAPAATSTSNKSIYTGSYQQKTYKPYNPTTYTGGTAATTTTKSSTAVVNSGGGSGSTYTVRKGDTVFEIMRQTGVYWKDIIRINNLQPPYSISPGQTIRLK